MKYIVNIIIVLYFTTIITNVYANDTSRSSIVMDMETGRILQEKNAHEKLLIASTTKIMTAILVIENADINEIVKVGNEILTMYGTNIYLDVGELITVKNLLYGLILRSGNDAAIVLANYIGGNEENFIQMMNLKAKEIGMNNTHFNNPHGLDDNTKNYSTAYDMALLSSYATKNSIYNKISKTKKYKVTTNKKSYLWYNRNKLLQQYEYCTGGKNGYTPDAGKTLVTTANKDKLNLTIVTLNDSNCYTTHKKLYESTFKKYKNYTIIKRKSKYTINNKNYYTKEKFVYPLTKEESKKIKTKVVVNNDNGYISIQLNDQEIGKIKLEKNIQKKEEKNIFFKIKNYLLEILKKLILGRQNNLNPGPLVPSPLEIYNSEFLTL